MIRFYLTKEQSLISELWEYFVDKYFSVQLENFSISTKGVVSLPIILVGITIGLVIATFGVMYNKHFLGDFVRHVIYNECFDASSAKTLSELGYSKNPGVRSAIKSGGTLSRWIRCVEEDEFYTEMGKKRAEFEETHKGDKKAKFIEPSFKRDLNTMHFYIPEEKKYQAEIKFDAKGASIGSFIAVIVGAIVLCAVLCHFLPDLLIMVDNFISITKGN